MSVQQKFQQAIGLHQQGRLVEAERLYEQVLARAPVHFDALHMLGVIALQTGRAERSAQLIEKAIKINPRIAAAFGNLGVSLQNLGRFADAVACFDKAIALQADFTEAYVNRANALQRLKRFDDAVSSYDRALESRPRSADIHNNRANALRALNRLDEAVTGYDKAIALKADFAEAFNNRGNALLDLGRLDEALASYGRASVLRANYAEAHSNRGNVLRLLRRFDDALAACDKAIALNPNAAEAHSNRGSTLADLKRFSEAVTCFDTAIALRPNLPESHGNRGNALNHLDRLDEAIASCNAAIALRPDYAEAYLIRGNAQQALTRYDEAVTSYDAAIAVKPDHADANVNKAYALLVTGQFDLGWRAYEWRKSTGEPTGNRTYPQPLWDGSQSIAGKTVFLHWEQGFGDTIQFSRYAGLLANRGAQVTLSVPDQLVRLFKQWEPRIEIIGGDRSPLSFDFHCPLMSLPYLLKTGLETIPAHPAYLATDPELKSQWAARLGATTRLRIGLAWRGNANHKNDRNRSIGLSQLSALLEFDADWISLQKEMTEQDATELGQMTDLRDEIGDFADTAGLIDQLDLVVTVDSSIAHLAAAMGKPTWILLPFSPEWRWLTDRSDSPWYPSVRLFRQTGIADWEPVIEQVKGALRTLAL